MTSFISRQRFKLLSQMQKNALITPGAYAASKELIEADIRSKKPLIKDIYAEYWNRCARAGGDGF